MESLGLSEFLKSVGNSVHSLNTICVGLHGVETRIYMKPDDLTVTWDPKDPCWSARKSRAFAINAAVVFVEEALMQYVRYLSRHPAAPDNLKQVNGIEGGAERLEHICACYKSEKKYWGPILLLLVHWRNRIVHPASSAKLKSSQESLLKECAEEIKKSHAQIDIEETLKHFHQKSITLKDASTLIAIAIRFARFLDEALQLDTATYEKIPYWLKHLGLEEQYRSICRSNGDEERSRRLRQFFKTNLPFIDEVLAKQVEEKPFSI